MAKIWNKGTLQTPNLRIEITNKHIWEPGKWVCHVREFNWSVKPLNIPNESTEQEAQSAALAMVKHHLYAIVAELE